MKINKNMTKTELIEFIVSKDSSLNRGNLWRMSKKELLKKARSVQDVCKMCAR